MSVPAAYLAVITIWSATPIAVVWSSETVSPVSAVWARMAIAAVIGLICVKLFRYGLPWHKRAIQTYACSVLGVYGAMMLTYLAAQSVPSGIISVMFSLSPLVSGLLAAMMLQNAALSPVKWIALVVALVGMVIIFGHSHTGDIGQLGDLAMLFLATFAFSLSGVMLKRIDTKIHHFSVTVGSLIVSMPLYLITWLVLDGEMPNLQWDSKSPFAILFLAIFGSLVGFTAYFYVLNRLAPSTVTLITMITPVFALYIGATFNGEVIPLSVYMGAGVILAGLSVYFYGEKIMTRFAFFPGRLFTK